MLSGREIDTLALIGTAARGIVELLLHQAGNIAFRFVLRFFGLRPVELVLSGYEIDRLYRLAGREPPKEFLQEEDYDLPVKILRGHIERIRIEKRPTAAVEQTVSTASRRGQTSRPAAVPQREVLTMDLIVAYNFAKGHKTLNEVSRPTNTCASSRLSSRNASNSIRLIKCRD